jgi:hypothetical protein
MDMFSGQPWILLVVDHGSHQQSGHNGLLAELVVGWTGHLSITTTA